jgi:hypothetical protein
MSKGGSASVDAPAEELGAMIDDLLNDLSNKFTTIASELTAKSTWAHCRSRPHRKGNRLISEWRLT